MKPYKGKQEKYELVKIAGAVVMVCAVSIICIIAINMSRQLASAHNDQRRADITIIIDAVYRYSADHNGSLPVPITATPNEICNTGSVCKGYVDLTSLAKDGKYLTSVPSDPTGSSVNGSGYSISAIEKGRITVSAPNAQLSELIKVTR